MLSIGATCQVTRTPQHTSALTWAHLGVPVFPCVAWGKTPAIERSFYAATTDANIINEWWGINPHYNPAFCPDQMGWCIVETDPGSEPLTLPGTYTVQSPRKGSHHYFEGKLPTTASKLALHVDTRGVGGYVLLPGSHVIDPEKGIDGGYEITSDADLAPVPAWIVERLNQAAEVRTVEVAELDLPGNVMRAATFLNNRAALGDVAVMGHGGNTRTYAVMCEVLDLGLSTEKTIELLEEHWNPHCTPPFQHDELVTLVENVEKYRQNAVGVDSVGKASDTFGHVLAALVETPEEEEAKWRKSRFWPKDWHEQEATKEPPWLIQGLIPERATVLMVGASGSYKSFLAEDIALAVATGRETFGVLPREAGCVFYAALEGKLGVETVRRRAWQLAREIEGPIANFYTMVAPYISQVEQVREFAEVIKWRAKGRPVKMVIIDTASKAMIGLDENSAGDGNRLCTMCDELVTHLGCAVLVLHHFGKDETKGARGSSALPAGFDVHLTVTGDKTTKMCAVRCLKQKDAPENPDPWTFEGKIVGPSLVFAPTTEAAYHQAVQSEALYTTSQVGGALQAIGATDFGDAVTTVSLATQMTPAHAGEGIEEHQDRVARVERTLNRLGKTKLRAYCHPSGRVPLWSLAPGPVRDTVQ